MSAAATPPAPLRRARLSVAAVFLVHAAVAGTLAPRIPAIKADLELGDAALGAALTAFAAGLFAGTRIAARLVERFGSRRVVRTGLPVLAASLAGPGLAGDLAWLSTSLAVVGVGSGVVDVAMNAQGVEVERGYGRPIMSALHGMWSVGLLAAGAIGAGVAAAGVGVRWHLVASAGLLAAAGALAPRGLLAGEGREPRARRAPGVGRAALPLAVIALGIVGFCSVLGEGAAADWSGVYLHQDAGAGAGLAPFAFVAFSLGMVASRFTADRLSSRFGPVSVVRVGGVLAALGLALGLAVVEPPAGLAAFALLGLGVAPIVPIVFSAAGNLGSGPQALGWVLTVTYVGSVLGPAAIGFVAHMSSLRTALIIPAALAIVATALAPFVRTAAGAPPAVQQEPPIV